MNNSMSAKMRVSKGVCFTHFSIRFGGHPGQEVEMSVFAPFFHQVLELFFQTNGALARAKNPSEAVLKKERVF